MNVANDRAMNVNTDNLKSMHRLEVNDTSSIIAILVLLD